MGRSRGSLVAVLGAMPLLAAGCKADDSDNGLFGDGSGEDGGMDDGGDGGDGDGDGGSSGDGGSDGAGDDGDGGGRFDVGSMFDLPSSCENPDGDDCHCTAVDILFVVDNSGSMSTHRAGVTSAFNAMVDTMILTLPEGTDLHVGLTRGTGFFDPGNSGGWSTCDMYQTGGSAWNPPDVGNTGTNGHQGRLFEHAGQRFAALKTGEDDPAAFRDWFGGALTGTIDMWANYSNVETVVAGAAYPFHPVNEAFNAGFLREQAVLVLFLLSDSPDLSPPTVVTQDMIDMVSTAKAGCGDHCIITSGAIAGACYDAPQWMNTRLTEFMNGFGSPPAAMIDINAGTPDFAAVLGDALADVIGETCDAIPPQG